MNFINEKVVLFLHFLNCYQKVSSLQFETNARIMTNQTVFASLRDAYLSCPLTLTLASPTVAIWCIHFDYISRVISNFSAVFFHFSSGKL